MAIRSWLLWISSCGDKNERTQNRLHSRRPGDKLLRVQSRRRTYLSKEVGDDRVRRGMGPSLDLKSDAKTPFGFHPSFCDCETFCMLRSPITDVYLVCSPVHPTFSTRVDVDEQQTLNHVRIIQLMNTQHFIHYLSTKKIQNVIYHGVEKLQRGVKCCFVCQRRHSETSY